MTTATDLSLFAEVLGRYHITDPDFMDAVRGRLESVILEPGEILVRAGSPAESFYLIVEGMVRYFYSDPDGKERNKAFFREGQFIGSLSAFLTRQVVPFNIQALEPSRFLRISLAQLESLQLIHGQLVERLISAVARELFVRNEQREAILLTGSAEQRYAWMKTHEAWLLDRVPQYQLASYLGMEPVSLSRLKKKPS